VFLLLGITLFGVGLLGEYVGRIYQQVQARPRFIIGAVLTDEVPAPGTQSELHRSAL
jgi:undecaprenyl-phosphate 4-deoxy-4-formamido-L-arabinose transferase